MIQRVISFVLRNIKNPIYLLRYAYAYPQKEFKNSARFLTEEELLQKLHEGKSLLRIGDGEIYMMNYGSITQYEDYNPELRKCFFTIAKEYNTSSPYIIGLPIFTNESNEDLKKKGKLNVWLPLKIIYRFIFPHDAPYFDAHIFYREGGFDASLAKILERYNIIIVTRKYNIDLMEEAQIKERFPVTYIETPERDSFAKKDILVKKIQNVVGNEKEKYRVILATGPASKALVYELSKQGIVSYDIGKGIEAMYRKNEIEHYI